MRACRAISSDVPQFSLLTRRAGWQLAVCQTDGDPFRIALREASSLRRSKYTQEIQNRAIEAAERAFLYIGKQRIHAGSTLFNTILPVGEARKLRLPEIVGRANLSVTKAEALSRMRLSSFVNWLSMKNGSSKPTPA
jgi:hypothetical protein